MHLGFAVNEVSEPEHTIKCDASYLSQSLPIRERKICVTCTQGLLVPQTQQCHLHTLKFSSFSPANFTDHHFAYYLALEKNKGALEAEYEPFTAFLSVMKILISSIRCCHETCIRQNYKSTCYFAISPLWPLGI